MCTGSNQGLNYYYYFYDWQIQEANTICISDRVPVIADITTGINEVNANNGISVYPNPVSSELLVRSSEKIQGIKIFDTVGKLVKQDLTGSADYRISVASLAKGVYQLQVNKNNLLYNYKLIVE